MASANTEKVNLREPAIMLSLLAAVAAIAAALFMTLGVDGPWSFILPFRGAKLATLVLVAAAISISTVIFQTATHNRILTPAIMGFDAMYVLIQTSLVFGIGMQRVVLIDPRLMFMVESVLMIGFSALLYQLMFGSGRKSLHLLVLVGVVLGVLFRSLSNFVQRLIDPNEFTFLQDRFFASFNNADQDLLWVSAIIILVVLAGVWRMCRTLDVLALGRETAISLGVPYRTVIAVTLILVAVLVSVSTALVGPVTFFGLLTAHIAYALVGSGQHRHILPASVLAGIILLVGGQMVLENLFRFDTNLRVIVEFAGGIAFLFLLMRGRAK